MVNAGVPFGAVVISLFTPFATIATYLFYSRRDIQPIKARSPLLVVVTDVILILYVMLLCFQRIFIDDYPCWLNLWSAYIGTIILANTYLWRCWTLFFSYNQTAERLQVTEQAAANGAANGGADAAAPTTAASDSFFFRNVALVKSAFLAKVAGVVLLILMIPCFAATGADDSVGHNVRDVKGIECDLGWSQTVLAVIVALYVCCFVFFAVQLRAVADNFRIKDELKITGLIVILAVIPWLLFNRVGALRDINDDTFPFSTLSLIIAVFAAFYCSTVWPLIASYSSPPTVADDAPEPAMDLENLENIIKLKDGFDSFRKFLSAEFSVENLLFWKDVEDFRLKIKAGHGEAFIKTENTRLFEKYIVDDGPFQVNLKEEIVKRIRAVVIDGAALPKPQDKAAAAPAPTSADGKDAGDAKTGDVALAPIAPAAVTIRMKDNYSPLSGEFPTCFDEAQAATFKLMKSDPFPRYKADPAYQQLIEKLSSSRRSTAGGKKDANRA